MAKKETSNKPKSGPGSEGRKGWAKAKPDPRKPKRSTRPKSENSQNARKSSPGKSGHPQRTNKNSPAAIKQAPGRTNRAVTRPDAVQNTVKEVENENYAKIIGRNPVREALRAGRNINKIYVAQGDTDYTLASIKKLASDNNVFVQETDRRKLDAMAADGNHQGIIAVCSPVVFSSLASVLDSARQKNEDPFLVILDEITDPHNAGAIIRSAYCAGAHGVVIGKRRSAQISEGVFKSSAGSVEYIPIVQVTNIAQTIDRLKDEDVNVVCCDMDGEEYYNLDLGGAVAVVVGSESEGVGKLIKSKCDVVASIPMSGKLDSLNASVAAGIILFEASKQRSITLK